MAPNKAPTTPVENLPQSPQVDLDPADLTTGHRIALVHILTPEFQGINPADFEDIDAEIVAKASPETLRSRLLDVTADGHSFVSYQPPEKDRKWIRMSVTPPEFGLFSRHVSMLARTAFNGVLASRDKKLQLATGDPLAKAQTEDDLRAGNRAAVRQVARKQQKMADYLDSDIMPRLELVEKFIEMTENPNLVRGSQAAVRGRFEQLRLGVFGDMLDAIGNQQKWTPYLAERAVRILQKRLYLEPDPIKRQANFEAMLQLAKEYYGSKRALVLGRIAESQKYSRDRPAVVQDIAAIDAERQAERLSV